MWDRIVYLTSKRHESMLDDIIENLPALERVNEMEASHQLGRELAEIIRRQIDGGVRKFVHAGATIPEIHEHTYHEPRALMSPEKKLLMPPPVVDTPPPPPPAKPDAGGSPEPDIKEILARMERMEKQQAQATSEPKTAKRRIKKKA